MNSEQPSRRDALASIPAAALGASIAMNHSTAPDTGKLRHSIVAWCWRNFGPKWSLEQVCEAAKATGCASVEIIPSSEWPTLAKYGLTCAMAPSGMDGSWSEGFNNPAHADELHAKTVKAIEDSIQNKEGLFACDLVVIEHLLMNVPEYLKTRRSTISQNSIAEALERAGARQVGRAMLHQFGYKRVWAVRQIDHWQKQTEGKRGAEYLRFLQIASGRACVAATDLSLEDIRRIGSQQKQMELLVKETLSM